MLSGVAAFSVALVASLTLTVPVRRLALRLGMVDQPGPRKVHLSPVPLLGGLAIYSGVILAIMIALDSTARAQTIGVLAGATLVAFVGMLDDRGWLHHQIKLFVGMPVAAFLLLFSGVRTHVLSAVIPGQAGHLADAGLTVLWVVGITAAFSILDHMDGLCAGVAAIACVFFFILATWSEQVLVATLAATVLGAAVGFLRWNFHPAKIFMGDGGAMLLGFLMAALALKLRLDGPQQVAGWIVPVLILGVPIFDTTLVSVSRLRRGLLPFAAPGKDHAAHRLSNLGLGQRGAVLALYGLGVAFGLVALTMSQLPWQLSYVLGAAAALGVILAVAWLERAPFDRQAKQQPQNGAPFLERKPSPSPRTTAGERHTPSV